jgi:aldehyde dehydrogenase (NAD+)
MSSVGESAGPKLTLPPTDELRELCRRALERCGVSLAGPDPGAPGLAARTPITGEVLFELGAASPAQARAAVASACEAFRSWRTVPAPVRGETVKRLGALIAQHKRELSQLVTVEVGKIASEAEGEVQEAIDMCDLALGLSRTIGGRTLPSERPGHRLLESWHPLGVVAIITAFNFPVAVWSWNVALALVCGDGVIWKPSPQAPLCALACDALLSRALADCGAPPELHRTLLGGEEIAGELVDSPDVALVSATGSERMGAAIAPRVARRFGRLLLELGGNNAAIVTPSADMDLAVRAITFAAAGTAGQRCTTLRRLIVHERLADGLLERLARTYRGLAIGSPLAQDTLVGPLISPRAWESMQAAVAEAEGSGGRLLVGGRRLDSAYEHACYVQPAIVEMPEQAPVVRRETFAPVLYALRYSELEEAIALHNAVPQGLSSAIFTGELREAERFLAADGSDCGLANVNTGTSGAEIGGAFGGEKSTGGGREAGSDAWRAYMRRVTSTVNSSDQLPLAQGVRFA